MEGLEERPLPDDEYDNYLAEVREMLFAGAADADVVAYLDEVEREFMGIDPRFAQQYREVVQQTGSDAFHGGMLGEEAAGAVRHGICMHSGARLHWPGHCKYIS